MHLAIQIYSLFFFFYQFPVCVSYVDDDDAAEKDASVGVENLEKKTRFKRVAKEDLSPIKKKKIKVSQDVANTYEKFVMHSRKFKPEHSKKKDAIP